MKRSIYLDNAATTPLAPEVKAAMIDAIELFGNPSSTHAFGRSSRTLIERVRKNIARTLHAESGEIFFTGSGTEADNLAILSSVRDLGVKRIITLPTEHHAVLNPAEFLAQRGEVALKLLRIDEQGDFDIKELETLLKSPNEKTLVSIMHGNNEIGNLYDIQSVGTLCRDHGALFHSDTVQTVGHFELNLSEIHADFITCSAHKFNGPKGCGFLFARGGVEVHAQIMGGGQERGLRSGTENVIGIAGLGAAFDLSYADLSSERERLLELKTYLIARLRDQLHDVQFNGRSADLDHSLYTVLNIAFPLNSRTEMLLFQLDLKGIAVSGGSACNSGAQKGSHVIESLRPKAKPTQNVRVSLGRYTTREEVDAFLDAIVEVVAKG